MESATGGGASEGAAAAANAGAAAAAASNPTSKSKKILCLHGQGTSGEILKRQTAPLFKHAEKEGMDYEFEFIDSPTPVVWDETSMQVCCCSRPRGSLSGGPAVQSSCKFLTPATRLS